MMLLDYLKKRQQMLNERNDIYTAKGVQVFSKDQMVNDLVDLESVMLDLNQCYQITFVTELR